ncbi:putative glycosyl transferase [compost metagenome]
MLATADIHLVLQKKSAADLVMPSKLTSILAAGGYALVTALPGTSLYDIVAQHQMGQLVKPESSEDLVKAIDFALSNDLEPVKKNARNYAEKHLSKEYILKSFENELINR